MEQNIGGGWLLPAWLPAALLLAGCDPATDVGASAQRSNTGPFEVVGAVRESDLDEISGLVTLGEDRIVVVNDGGKPRIHVLGIDGRRLARIEAAGAKNRDWEDVARVDHDGRALLAICDVGDNHARYDNARLYFLPLPEPDADGRWPERMETIHVARLNYPDGPRDTESVAWDPRSDRLIFVTKRDHPARIYSISVSDAMANDSAGLRFDGELPAMRPPNALERRGAGKRARFIAQPTGMDISPDGRMAAIITYRGVLLYDNPDGLDWVSVLKGGFIEVPGPPGWHQEAVGFTPSGRDLLITTERLPAPIHRLRLTEFSPD